MSTETRDDGGVELDTASVDPKVLMAVATGNPTGLDEPQLAQYREMTGIGTTTSQGSAPAFA